MTGCCTTVSPLSVTAQPILDGTNHPDLAPSDLTDFSANASESCNILSPTLCKMVNADGYTALLFVWISIQLAWVGMLLFVQFIQVSRAMTTFENMYGIQDPAASLAFTSTGAPLDPNHAVPAAIAAPDGSVPPGAVHKHGHRGGFLKQVARLLGVEPFLETIRGRGAATGGGLKNAGRRKKRNPYSKGVIVNCRDFWCDPAPLLGKRENGSAMLDGEPVNYTDMYESPSLMTMGRGRRRGGYEAVPAAEEV